MLSGIHLQIDTSTDYQKIATVISLLFVVKKTKTHKIDTSTDYQYYRSISYYVQHYQEQPS